MYPCDRARLELIETARFRSTNSVDLRITPGQLWQVLDDAEAWPRWSYLDKLRKYTEQRFGVSI
jgi:hypothetical protein